VEPGYARIAVVIGHLSGAGSGPDSEAAILGGLFRSKVMPDRPGTHADHGKAEAPPIGDPRPERARSQERCSADLNSDRGLREGGLEPIEEPR
jgi:hypothetical protein